MDDAKLKLAADALWKSVLPEIPETAMRAYFTNGVIVGMSPAGEVTFEAVPDTWPTELQP